MDRGAWWATVHGVSRNPDTTEHTHTLTSINNNANHYCEMEKSILNLREPAKIYTLIIK